jgi:hypothetical protein
MLWRYADNYDIAVKADSMGLIQTILYEFRANYR